jgi:hypothetical protein
MKKTKSSKKQRVTLDLNLETLQFINSVVELTKVSRDDVIAVILAIEIFRSKKHEEKITD